MTQHLFGDRADLYEVVYDRKDFATEAARLHELLAAEGVSDGARLLDAACGTGAHLAHLRAWYEVAGFDASEDMLALARARLPGLPLMRAGLEDFVVDEPFDVVTCLFSSIGYLVGERALRSSAERFAAAVRPGGVLVLEPWYSPEKFDAGRPHAQCSTVADVSVARVTATGLEDGDVARLDMHYLVARRDGPVEAFDEVHRLWLCPPETLVRAFSGAGFDVRTLEDGLMPGRGLLVGHRRG